MKKFIVTGTDTEIGKTVCAAMLTLALDGSYWKPVQSGIAEGTDRKTVQSLTGLPDERFPAESYVLTEPLSPHRSAELDNVRIEPERLEPPVCKGPLIIEGAGGLMVPLTRDKLYIDQFKEWGIPLILCARTALGTINHTLLSVEALKALEIPLMGLVFIGEDNPDNIRTIHEFSGAKVLGHIPRLKVLNAKALTETFEQNFTLDDFDG